MMRKCKMDFIFVFFFHKRKQKFSHTGFECDGVAQESTIPDRKNFGRLKISDGFIFGRHFCPKLKAWDDVRYF